MEYVKKNMGSYQLHMIRTTAFKSIAVNLFFHNQIQKEKVTERNFLINLLLSSTKNIQSKQDLSIHCQDLYAAQISCNNRRIGAFLDTSFSLSVLEDQYTEKGNFRKSLELLHEILFHPNIEKEAFSEKDFLMIKEQLETNLKASKENLSYYSIVRALENTDSKSPLSIRGEGYLEDLEKITPHTLYKHYKEMIEKDTIDLFIIGNIDFEKTKEEVEEIFEFKTFKKEKGKAILPNPKIPKKIRTITEEEESNQTHLVLVSRLCDLEEYERKYPLTLYNILLGGSGDSRLFKEVREKKSLCYAIRSVVNKSDNCLLITAGITKERKKEAVKAIQEQIKALASGKIQEEDLLKAKEFYLSSFDAIEDSMGRIIESYYMMELLGVDDIETKKKKMKEVSVEEVIAVAKKVKMELVYTLEGESYEKVATK